MKTLLIALNSKYIHSSLAPWYLKAACGDGCGEIIVLEHTINDDLENVLGEVYSLKPDIAALSCYIWNIGKVLRLSENLKKVLPSVKIVLGGPEVSFDAVKIMEDNLFIDYIITGEGETSFKSLLTAIKVLKDESKKSLLSSIDGLVYRFDGNIFSNDPCKLIKNLDLIPSPYTDEMLASTSGRVVYFESSRGCPFSCSYCLSSTIDGVRYFSLDRVKSELLKLIKAGVKLIKFVDRTFNCNKARAKEIFKFVIEHGENTLFHFEAAADLFDNEMIEILSQAPFGRIQLEIGIQSTNIKTLAEVNRISNLDRVFNNVLRLGKPGNIHLHLDLIAGLPYEDFCSFKASFDAVYALKPHNLQLGFLKMLKGSKIRREAYKYSYNYRNYPPYEVLGNSFIDFGEIIILKGIEEILERYYNSGRFVRTLEYVIGRYFSSAFDFYYSLYEYCKSRGWLKNPVSSRKLYSIFLDYIRTTDAAKEYGLLSDLLKLDFLASDRSNNLPKGISRELPNNFRERCFDFLKNEENIKKYLSEFVGQPAKQIYKHVHFEYFAYDVTDIKEGQPALKKDTILLFDYTCRNKVTGLYNYQKLQS
jgi:radical SAM superfamily enzyme YgiQ (UPF0313 family)